MDRQYYYEYYDLERSHWWFLARAKILETQIKLAFPAKTDLKILNIGVATGASSEMLSKFGEVISIEYNQECIDFTKDKLSFEVAYGSILELQFPDNHFDLVCAFDVIEHVEDDYLGTKEMFRVCKKNGIVFVTVPAFMSLWGPHDLVNQHYRRYQKTGLLDLSKSMGELSYFTYFNFLLFLPVFLIRKLLNLLPKNNNSADSGSDLGLVKSNFINTLCYHIFFVENTVLRRKIALPFGVSAMAIWRKK